VSTKSADESGCDFALLGHPSSYAHLVDLFLRSRPDYGRERLRKHRQTITKFFEWTPCYAIDDPVVLALDGGVELTGRLIVCTFLPEELQSARQIAKAHEKSLEGLRVARDLGARVVGLGGFTSIVSDVRGRRVTESAGTDVTSGSCLTAALALAQLDGVFRRLEWRPDERTVAVLGATGKIGRACALALARRARRLVLVARNAAKLEALASELESHVDVEVSADLRDVREASVVVAATSASSNACLGSRRRGIGIERKILGIRDCPDKAGRRRDHGRVVGAERERRGSRLRERCSQLGVRSHPADDGDLLGAGLIRGRPRPLDESPNNRTLVARGEIRTPSLQLARVEVAHRVEQSRLHAREGEVETADARDREVVGLGVALPCEPIDRRTARVAEAEQAAALVEGLACRVVEGRAEASSLGVIVDVEEERMAAARQQAEERRLERIRLQVERGDVTVEVIDRHERTSSRPGERLGGCEPDEERADQAWALRDRHRIDLGQGASGLAQRLANDRQDELEMAARGDLRHDPSVAGVQVCLRGDDIGQDLAVGRDDRGCRLVTRGLDPEDHGRGSWSRGLGPGLETCLMSRHPTQPVPGAGPST
jgi:hypothetical protein